MIVVLLLGANRLSGWTVPLYGGLEPDCRRGLIDRFDVHFDADPLFICDAYCLYPAFNCTLVFYLLEIESAYIDYSISRGRPLCLP